MAITTMYAGIEFRSRLEARWAAFFSRIGWHYTYEPFDGAGYIPDFLIHGERPLLVEIKPAVTLKDYTAPTAKAENGLREWDSDILILGADPLPHLPYFHGWKLSPAGLLGEIVGEGIWEWGTALWAACDCRSIGVIHCDMTYSRRPCGCYDGDQQFGPVNLSVLQAVWAEACNEVKWRGKAA